MWMIVLSTKVRLSIVGQWAEIGILSINIRAKMAPPVCILGWLGLFWVLEEGMNLVLRCRPERGCGVVRASRCWRTLSTARSTCDDVRQAT
jgi:hypothetical protein